jgi:hypothetical protein
MIYYLFLRIKFLYCRNVLQICKILANISYLNKRIHRLCIGSYIYFPITGKIKFVKNCWCLTCSMSAIYTSHVCFNFTVFILFLCIKLEHNVSLQNLKTVKLFIKFISLCNRFSYNTLRSSVTCSHFNIITVVSC